MNDPFGMTGLFRTSCIEAVDDSASVHTSSSVDGAGCVTTGILAVLNPVGLATTVYQETSVFGFLALSAV